MPAPWRFLPAVNSFGGKNCRYAIEAGGGRCGSIKSAG
jgi:hypothetical protein